MVFFVMSLTDKNQYSKLVTGLALRLVQFLFALFCCRDNSHKTSSDIQSEQENSDSISESFSQIYTTLSHALHVSDKAVSLMSGSRHFQRQQKNHLARTQLAQIRQDSLDYKALTSAIALVSCYRQEGDPDHINIACSIDPTIAPSCVLPRSLKKPDSFQVMPVLALARIWWSSSFINIQTEKQGTFPCISYA